MFKIFKKANSLRVRARRKIRKRERSWEVMLNLTIIMIIDIEFTGKVPCTGLVHSLPALFKAVFLSFLIYTLYVHLEIIYIHKIN